jgi:hypothetical protein
MVDWISPKVATTLAALILLAGLGSFVLAQREESRRASLQSIADRAAAFIEGVSGTEDEVAASMSLGPGGAFELPDRAAGDAYSLSLYRSYVVAGFDGKRAFAVLRTPLHLWEPYVGPYTTSSMADLDALHPSLTLESGGAVIVSRRSITVDGSATWGTFAFL